MAPPTCSRAAAGPPSQLRLALMGAIVAGLAVPIESPRLEGFAVARSGAVSGRLAGRRTAARPKPAVAVEDSLIPTSVIPPESDKATAAAAGKGFDPQALRSAARFIDSVKPSSPHLKLSDIRDIMDRFENLRKAVLANPRGDTRTRNEVRRLLRDIRTKGEALSRLAERKVSEGEADDGGDIPPSLRRNICSKIEKFSVGEAFRAAVMGLCKALDAVRYKVLAGESKDAAVHEASVFMETICAMKEYSLPQVSWGIASLLGEEWRWLEKQPSNNSTSLSGRGNSSAQSPKLGAVQIRNPVLSKKTVLNSPVLREGGLEEARFFAQTVIPEELPSLSLMRASITRLEVYREMVAEYIPYSDPPFCERIREVLRLIKEKTGEVMRLAAQKAAEGEVDHSDQLLPSQRENICKNLESFGLGANLYQEVLKLCEALDRVRETVHNGGDEHAALMMVVARMTALKKRPDFFTTRCAQQLSVVFAEEWRWLKAQGK